MSRRPFVRLTSLFTEHSGDETVDCVDSKPFNGFDEAERRRQCTRHRAEHTCKSFALGFRPTNQHAGRPASGSSVKLLTMNALRSSPTHNVKAPKTRRQTNIFIPTEKLHSCCYLRGYNFRSVFHAICFRLSLYITVGFLFPFDAMSFDL